MNAPDGAEARSGSLRRLEEVGALDDDVVTPALIPRAVTADELLSPTVLPRSSRAGWPPASTTA
jgi:hypothetical protein